MRTKSRELSAVILGGLMLAGSLAPRRSAFAQQPARPSFEVASIKPGDPGISFGGIGFSQGGTFTASSASLGRLIGFAYDVRNYQVSGGPNWLDSAKFDIDAKADSAIAIPPGLAGFTPMRLMLQSLLAERYKLAVHRETREEQIYELVLDKRGSKLQEVTSAGQLRMGRGELTGKGAPVQLLVNQLSQQLGRSVIDKTGLTGRYDFALKWTPDPVGPGGPPDGPDAAPPPDPSGPSLFTAVQEDLGLKLQSAKGPVEVIVIDHVEKPDAN
jgi:bla regulator protein BlaR1